MIDAGASLNPHLSNDERTLLLRGLGEWGGLATMTDRIASLIGFADAESFRSERDRMSESIRTGSPMSQTDWRRALLGTEIAFVSDVLGVGVDWPTTTGLEDVNTISILRGLQRKLI